MLVSTRSLTATTSTSGARSRIALRDWRPMRPKPLMPTRTVMRGYLLGLATGRADRGLVSVALLIAREAAHDERLGAGERDVAAEARRDDGQTWRARTSNASARDRVAHLLEEALALRLGDRAADDDPMRVERVDVARHSRPRRRAGRGS